MRYDKRITLHETMGKQYNPDTSKTEVTVDAGVTLPCNLSPVSVEKAAIMFGSIGRKLTTARLQRPYRGDADKAVIDGDKYNIVQHIPYRTESVLYLEGVSEWS